MNSEQDQQDHGKTTGMEDSTMTIEFLRARLLSERSVSSSARQRAKELAKRVAELEEQLNVVLSQKKMAEKAASEVLAILEDNGISDIFETVESVTDESKVGEDANSDQESYSVLGGSLSWKGRKSSPSSLEKLDFSTRRRSSSVSIVSSSSSPKHHPQGRSCRKMKCRETRSLDKESKSNAIEVCTQENATAISLEDSPNRSGDRPRVSREGSGTSGEEVLSDGQLLGSSQDQRKDSETKNSLERQVQSMDHYEEAMEKAQREWEEKFRENNNCTPESCDHGNHSDITKERYEIQSQTPTPSHVPSLYIKEKKSQVEESETFISRESPQAQPNISLPPSSVGPESKSITPHPLTEVNLTQNNPENHQHQSSYINQQNYQTSKLVFPDAAINGHNSKSDNLYALVLHQPAPLDGVLEALKNARLSLQKKIEHMPSMERGETAAPRIGDRVEMPINSAGLFRLPTDFSDSQLRSESNRFVSGRYMDTIQSFSRNDILTGPSKKDPHSSNLLRDDRFLSSRFSESGPSFTSQKQSHFDRNYLDAALPASSGMYNPLLPEETWVPSSKGFSRTFPSGKFATPPFPPSKQYALYEDQIMRRNI